MKLLCIVIATWLCLNSMCLGSSSSPRFSSYLKTAFDNEKATGDYTSRVFGPNGYCLEVGDTDYHNGVSVILQPCDESDSKVTQLWTFGSDGTVKSNGKCLTPYEYNSAGAYVMIFDCPETITTETTWKLETDRKLVNPSGLVLTATSGMIGSGLTLEIDVSSSYQTWVVNNYTKPSLVSIEWGSGFCLEMSGIGSKVMVKKCDSIKAGQQWLVYPDGTIRPEVNKDLCLSTKKNIRSDFVVVMPCGLAPVYERWLYMPVNGAIMNQRANFVMEGNTMFGIILSGPDGHPIQKWVMAPLLY